MEYAIRHPDRVSQLILLDTAPASAGDWRRLRESFAERRPAEDQAEMAAIARHRRVRSEATWRRRPRTTGSTSG